MISVLAVVGIVQAIVTRNPRLRYITLVLVVSFTMLCVAFGGTSPRYFIPLLPLLMLLAASALVWIISTVRVLATRAVSSPRAYVVATACGLLLVGASVFSEMAPLATFSPGLSAVVGLSYPHQNPDYQRAGDYLIAHWQPGDTLIADGPAIVADFYAPRPSFQLYEGKALYILEQGNHIIESYVGVRMLINQEDLQQVLAQSHRVWLLSVNANCCSSNFGPQIGVDGFQLVFEGQRTYVYLRSG